MFDLRELRYFVAVAELENVAQAARQLNITQSPLSRQILGLEAKLGLDLFVRDKKRLKLNEAGQRFLKDVKALLSHGDLVERRISAASRGETGFFRLGYVDGALHCGAMGIGLRAVKVLQPKTEIEARLLRSSQQFDQLSDGRLDVGLTYGEPPVSAKMTASLVHEEGLLLAVPSSHGTHGRCQAKDLDGQVFVSLPDGEYFSVRREIEAACAKAGFAPVVRNEAVAPLAVMDMVAAGLGLGFVQESLAKYAPSEVALLTPPSNFDFRIKIYAVSRQTSPTIDAFLTAFKII